jgi:NAD(P)-dependent dehydrogenase (short-subunit alcohol dehydrogenase family)
VQLKPISEQVVVVFGASSGIGRETALRFARQGAIVVAAARGEEGLNSLVEEIQQSGGRATAVPAEAADFAQVQAVADTAVRLYGRIDTWVHVAAVSIYATFEETTPEEFRRIVDVNLLGQVYGAMAALPALRCAGQGALIHISSVEAMRPLPYQSAYAASKHGVHGLLQTLRMELRHEKLPIHVTEIMPASINTPLFNKARTKLGVKPMGIPPVYPPSLVADAILYAAEHPVREIVVGGAGKMMLYHQRISPRLTDLLMEAVGFKGQKTREPKSAEAPNNLFSPLSGYDRVEGDFGGQAKVTGALERSPAVRIAVAGLAAGTLALLVSRSRHSKKRRGIV